MKIIVCSEELTSWGGGVDFLCFYLSILNQSREFEISLALPQEQSDQRLMRVAKNIIKKLLGRKRQNLFDNSIFEQFENVKKIKYRKGKLCAKTVKGFDLVFLVTTPIAKVSRKKQIGYIPDLQHLHLTQFFNDKERTQRDILFKNLLRNCATIFVNSEHTQQDIKINYPEQALRCNFYSMKFLPIAKEIKTLNTPLNHYNLPDHYFMIANQLWVHKDHPTALRALAQLLEQPQYNDVQIICSGGTYDYRQPNYFEQIKNLIKELNIENNVHFVGYIPKPEQLAILQGAVAVIQPTLFEGGRGGGATYDAVAYGQSAIISDIEINREIDNKRVKFFVAGDSNDLCQKMHEALKNPIEPLPLEQLKEQNKQNFEQAKIDLEQFFHDTTQN